MCLNVTTAKIGYIEIVLLCHPRLSVVYGPSVLKHYCVGNVLLDVRMMLKPDLQGNLHLLY